LHGNAPLERIGGISMRVRSKPFFTPSSAKYIIMMADSSGFASNASAK